MKWTQWICIFILLLGGLLTGCQQVDVGDQTDIGAKEWGWVLDSAEGTTLTLYHNLDDEYKLEWLDKELKDALKAKHNITLVIEKKPLPELIEKLVEQKRMEVDEGSMDLIVAEGVELQAFLEKELVYEPFLDRVPNYHINVNPEDYEYLYAEGQKLNFSALPIFRNQLALVYDEDELDEPPATLAEMLDLLTAAPGAFTFPMPDDLAGRQFMETYFASLTDYEELYALEPRRETVEPFVMPALEKLKVLKNALYKKGEIYPADEEQLDQLFHEREIGFSLTTNPFKSSRMAKLETYPYGARAFVPEGGTVGDTTYMVIPYNSLNKSGGMVAANLILTTELQLPKYKEMKAPDLPVIDTERMSKEDARPITRVTVKRADLDQQELLSRRIPDMPEQLSTVLETLWREILE